MKRENWIEKGFSEEQTTDVLNEFHSLNKENDNLKKQIEALKSQSSKVMELEKQLDEINKSKMTEQEQAEAKKKEADEYYSKAQKIYNTAKAKEILAGYDVDDEIINNLVVNDESQTLTNATKLKELLDFKIENTTKKVKDELSNLNAKPNPSNVPNQDDTMTKEKFSKMTMLEQKQWKEEHLDEYHEMYSKN